jgi:hypothetical protein
VHPLEEKAFEPDNLCLSIGYARVLFIPAPYLVRDICAGRAKKHAVRAKMPRSSPAERPCELNRAEQENMRCTEGFNRQDIRTPGEKIFYYKKPLPAIVRI